MIAIAAVDKNWAIGKDGKLLFHIKEDMQQFREHTSGNIIVMGRKTLETFPGGRPLEGRENIIFSTNPSYSVKGALVVHSHIELFEYLEDLRDKGDDREVFIVGGEKVYGDLIDYCDYAIITKIDFAADADAYFPDLDKREGWILKGESDENTSFDLAYTFCVYENTNPRNF